MLKSIKERRATVGHFDEWKNVNARVRILETIVAVLADQDSEAATESANRVRVSILIEGGDESWKMREVDHNGHIFHVKRKKFCTNRPTDTG